MTVRPLDIFDLHHAYRKTHASTQKKAGVFTLREQFDGILDAITRQAYQPGRYDCFVVREPKLREVFAPCFRDRLVHHLIVDRIAPELEKKLIYDSHANRNGKGVHSAVARLQHFLRQAPPGTSWAHCDIQTYFTSIDKNVLFDILKARVASLKDIDGKEKARILSLSFRVIFQNPADDPRFTGNQHLLRHIPKHKSLFHRPAHVGLPIGSLTSQAFSNLYLNELDRFCKHTLRIKRYLRYVDDFMIVGYPVDEMKAYIEEIRTFLKCHLRLDLHPKKTTIQPVNHGVDFLGYLVFPHFTAVRQRTIRSFRRRLYLFNHILDPQTYPVCSFPGSSPLRKLERAQLLRYGMPTTCYFINHALQVINSYYGIFSHAQTYELRKTLYHRDFRLLKDFVIPIDGYRRMHLRSIRKLKEEGRVE